MFKKRALTGLIILAVTVGFFALRLVTPYLFDVYVGALVIIGTFEVCNVFDKAGTKNDVFVIITYPVLCYVALILTMVYKWNFLMFLAIIILLAVLLLAICFCINNMSKSRINREMVDVQAKLSFKKYVRNKCLRDLFLLFFPTLPILSLFVLNHLPSFVAVNENDAKLLATFMLIGLFATTILTDTIAYLIGSGIGGKKLCPKISPNKTISGAIGGLVGGILASMLLFFILALFADFRTMFLNCNISIWVCLVYGIIASVFTQLGDIFASAVKRKVNAKDYGKILPGHGGIMDRIDGLMFNGLVLALLSLILL